MKITINLNDKITAKIHSVLVTGIVNEVVTEEGKTFIDFTDSNGDSRWCYPSQLTELNDQPVNN